MQRKRILFFIFLQFLIAKSYSQSYVDPASADNCPWMNNDYGIQKDVGSDLYTQNFATGTALINIPIYSYKLNGLDLGVKLFYNTQGIQVNRVPSPIGIGWELNAAATITRQVRGNPDDFAGIDNRLKVQWHGYWQDAQQSMADYYYYNHLTADPNLQTIQDDEPDLFYLSFEGRNITFTISKTGNIVTIPNTPGITITRNYTPFHYYLYLDGSHPAILRSTPNALNFQVKDEKGNIFNFVANNTWQGSFNGWPLHDNWTFSNDWTVSSIITYEGQTIQYEYGSEPILPKMAATASSETFWEKNNNYGVDIWQDKNSDNTYSFGINVGMLKAIHYPNNIDVVFNYNFFLPESSSYNFYLASIDIKERKVATTLTPVKYSYIFNQALFSSPSPIVSINPDLYYGPSAINDEVGLGDINENLRLKLKSIDFKGTDGSSIRRLFTFNYNPVPLPPRNCGLTDLYGYANGTTPQYYDNGKSKYYLTIAKHSFSGTSGGSSMPNVGIDKTVSNDVRIVGAESLIGITNDKGGQINFVYEVNSGGGLRIYQIISYDGYNHDNDIAKEYTYNGGWSFPNEGPIKYSYKGAPPSESSTTWDIWSNSCNVLNTALNGSRNGFTEVVEQVNNIDGSQISKTDYQFTGLNPGGSIGDNLFQDSYSVGGPFFLPPFANSQYIRFWGVGLPTSVTKYDNSNNIVSQTNYAYTVTTTPLNVSDFQATARLYLENPVDQSTYMYKSNPDQAYTTYYPLTGCTLLASKQTETFYNNTSHIDVTETYSYDGKNNLQSKKKVNSLGQTILENYYYNYDWISTSYYSGPGIASLNADNIQRLIYTEKWKNTASSTNLINLTVTGQNNIASGSKIVRPYYTYQLATSTPLSVSSFYPDATSQANNYGIGSFDINSMTWGSAINNFRIINSTKQYDDQGNALDIMSVGGHRKAIVFDNEQNNTLAEANNATYNDIAYCGFESNYSATGVDYKKGNWSFDNSKITTTTTFLGRCSYNVTTSPNIPLTATGNLTVGKQYTVSFWIKNGGSVIPNDGVNPVPIATGPTYNGWTLKKATFTAQANTITLSGSGYVDELKLYPVNAIMITHNYLPLVGKTADVDANDNITYYEYDPFGNLTVKKDQYGNVISKTKTITQGAE